MIRKLAALALDWFEAFVFPRWRIDRERGVLQIGSRRYGFDEVSWIGVYCDPGFTAPGYELRLQFGTAEIHSVHLGHRICKPLLVELGKRFPLRESWRDEPVEELDTLDLWGRFRSPDDPS